VAAAFSVTIAAAPERIGLPVSSAVPAGAPPLDPAQLASSEDAPTLLAAEDGRSVRLVRVSGPGIVSVD
jgi:hypothetical protein